MTHYCPRDDTTKSKNTHIYESWSRNDRRLDRFREQVVPHTPEKLLQTGLRRQLWAKIEMQLATLKLQKMIETRRRYAFRLLELNLHKQWRNWIKQALAMTHCQFCGKAGLSLLTSSSRTALSPNFQNKVLRLLPPESLREFSIGDVSTMPDNRTYCPDHINSSSSECVEENFRPLLRTDWLDEGEITPKRNCIRYEPSLASSIDNSMQRRRGYSLPRLGASTDSRELNRSSTHWHQKEERGRKVIPRFFLKKPAGRIFCSRLEKIFNRRKAWGFAILSF